MTPDDHSGVAGDTCGQCGGIAGEVVHHMGHDPLPYRWAGWAARECPPDQRHGDVQFGGGLRRKAVVGQLNEVVDLLHGTHPPDVHTELYRVTADLAETAGNVLWDSGQRGRAQHYFTLGIKAASQAGDRPLAAHILATMAVQAVESRDLHGGLDLIQLAQHGIRRTPLPRMTAMLATREGWIYAQLGRVQDCHRAIGYAEEAFAGTCDGDAPTWLDYFTAAELAGSTASDYRDLAVHDPAQFQRSAHRFERALTLRGDQSLRSRVFDLTELANVHIRQGNVEQGCVIGHRAADTARSLNSYRVNQRLTNLLAATEPYRTLTVVTELREHIDALVEPAL